MENENQMPSRIDTIVEKFLTKRSQTISRRGILARLGKFSLGVLGVSLLPNLPLDRTFIVDAQSGCCHWSLCGIKGYLCPGGATASSCPSGTQRGPSMWSRCCTDPDSCTGGGRTVEYWDCCATTVEAAAAVRGAQCIHNPNAGGAWCPTGVSEYGCTYAEVKSTCTSPVNNPC
jgi:methylamine dehydrogenase light chain